MSGPIPERWLDCPRKAQRLILDKFYPFKTPLSNNFDDKVPQESQFTPSMLLNSMKNSNINLGLWINLTNTSRYYDQNEIKNWYGDDTGIMYVSLQCKGRGEAPDVQQTKSFIKTCDQFIQQHPLKKIGVHCTHGFNRTGFLIASFLVEVYDWDVIAAIQEFAKARPPGIYKQDYLDELVSRYESEPIPAPLRPEWCYGEIDSSSEDETEAPDQKRKRACTSNNGTNVNKKKRKLDKIPEFMEGVSGIYPVLEEELHLKLLRLACAMCKSKSFKFPGAQPVSMTRQNISFLEDKPYRVSWKADGTRYMLLVVRENEVYFLDRDNNVFEISGLKFVCKNDQTKHLTNSLMDGEMVIDEYNGNSIPRYLVYDVVFINDQDVSTKPFFPTRLQIIEDEVIKPRYKAIEHGKIDRASEPFSVRAKQFCPIEKTSSFFSEKFQRQLGHKPDGLIFQPSIEPYKPGTCNDVLKWKPSSLNSVDFKLKIVTESGAGLIPKKVCHLMVGELELPFGMMDWKSSLNCYNNKIIECKFENNKWVFMRERTDKSAPNHFTTAHSVQDSIQHPITTEILLDFIHHRRYRDPEELMPPPKNIRPPHTLKKL